MPNTRIKDDIFRLSRKEPAPRAAYRDNTDATKKGTNTWIVAVASDYNRAERHCRQAEMPKTIAIPGRNTSAMFASIQWPPRGWMGWSRNFGYRSKAHKIRTLTNAQMPARNDRRFRIESPGHRG